MVRCRDLNEQLEQNTVADRDFVNVAPLQLSEKIIDLHLAVEAASFGAREATIFSKRGSSRSGAHNG